MFARFRRRRRSERGAVALLVSLLLTVLLIAAALVVDLGMQRVGRSDMQALADVVALDLARELDGTKTVTQLNVNKQALANASRDRNRSVIGYGRHLPELAATYGTLGPDGKFVAGADAAVPTAVQVKATTDVDFTLGGVTGRSEGGASRTAVATANPNACFTVGSFALGLKSNASILRALLGNTAALRVLSYSGVVTPKVSLLGLATKLNVASPEEVLSLSSLSIGDFLLASADVLDNQGDHTASAFLAGLKADLGPLASKPIDLLGQIAVTQGSGSALNADLDILSLVGGGLFLANGANAIGLNLGVANLADVKLGVLQKKQMACNSGIAEASQVDIAATVSVLGLINVRVKVGLAQAKGKLASLSCATGAPNSMAVYVYDQRLAKVSVSVSVLSPTEPGVVRPPAPSGTYQLPLDASYTVPVVTDAGKPGLSETELNASVAGLNLGPIIMGLLRPVLLPTVDALVGTLLDTLGIKVAGADLLAVEKPTCASPRLVG